MENLQIRYIERHFTLVILEDMKMPKNRVSALRGGGAATYRKEYEFWIWKVYADKQSCIEVKMK